MKKLFFLLMLAAAVVSCQKSEDDTSTDPQTVGIIGEWYSSRTDVAPLLALYFSVDSIYARFDANFTYYVRSRSNGAFTTYTGTYSQSKSGVGNIWNITLYQSSPTAVVSSGIFEISTETTPFTMRYEVAQTSPSIGATPPTATAGFGSTNGGALGTINIQKFKKIVKQ